MDDSKITRSERSLIMRLHRAGKGLNFVGADRSRVYNLMKIGCLTRVKMVEGEGSRPVWHYALTELGAAFAESICEGEP